MQTDFCAYFLKNSWIIMPIVTGIDIQKYELKRIDNIKFQLFDRIIIMEKMVLL